MTAAQSRTCRSGCLLVLAILGMAATLDVGRSCAAPQLPGSAQRQAKEEALRAIPLAQLAPEHRARVHRVVEETTVFRRLPTQTIVCDPKFFRFMVEHPDVVVSIWRTMGLSEIRLRRTGSDTFRADDGAGTTGELEFIHRSDDTHLMLADGAYEGSLLPKQVRGQCLLILKSTYTKDASGRELVTCRLDSFLFLENVTFDVLAKTFQPLVAQMADHNFRETLAFVSGLNQAAETNPDGVQQMADKLRDVSPETRQELSQLSEQLAVEAALAKTPAPPLRTAAPAAPPTRAPRR